MRIEKIVFATLFFIGVSQVSAQPPDTLWTKTYGGSNNDFGYSAQQTSDAGYIIVGGSNIGPFNSDIYFIKTDASGNVIWSDKFGSTSDQETGFSVDQTSDGGYIAAGVVGGFSGTKVYLIKVDSLGDSLWADDYGIRAEVGNAVQQTSDGRYIIAGYTEFYGSGGSDVQLLRINRNGGVMWSEVYGDTADEAANSVQQTNDGGYIVVGYTESFGAGGSDVWLLKTDSNGDTIWTKTFGDHGHQVGNCVQQTDDSGYIITGVSNNDLYLIKTDANGDTIWTKTFGDGDYDAGESIKQTIDGGYIIAGRTCSYGAGDADVWLIKIDANGSELWSQTYGGIFEDCGYEVEQTTDDGYAIAGYTRSYGAGGADVYLIKTGPEGPESESEVAKELSDVRIPSLVNGNILMLTGIRTKTEFNVFDIIGKEVLNGSITQNEPNVRLNNLNAGIYFLLLKEEKTELHKFVLIK